RIRAVGQTLQERAEGANATALLPDLERIRTAAERLDTLLAHGGVPPASPPQHVAAGVDSVGPEQSPSSILVLDDNEGNCDMLARRLARQGYEVRTAVGGAAALEALAKEAVDLVLLDVMMPDLDGYHVLERMKADPGLRDIPVLMISALDELESVVRCIQ